MKRIRVYNLIVPLLLVLTIKSNAYVCYLKINLNECETCLGNINEISLISPKLNPTFVFPLKDTQFAEEMIYQKYNLDLKNYKYLFSDSLYRFLDEEFKSQIILFDENRKQMILKAPLTELSVLIKIINTYASNYSDVVVLSDLKDILLSNNLTLYLLNKNIFIFDNLLNKYLVLKDSIVEEFIDGKILDKEFVHRKYFGDTSGYYVNEKYKKDLFQSGRNEINLGQLIFYQGYYYCFLTYYYPEVISKGNQKILGIRAKFLIGKFNNNTLIDAYPVENPRLPYDIDQYNCFFIKNNYFYISIFKNRLGLQNKFLGKYTVTKGKLKYLHITRHQLPLFFKKNNLQYDFVDLNIKGNYLFFTVCNEILNFHTNKREIKLEKYENVNSFDNKYKPILNFDIFDIKQDTDYIYILVHDSDFIKVWYFDRDLKVPYRLQTIGIYFNSIIAFPLFYKNGIIMITRDKRILYLS